MVQLSFIPALEAARMPRMMSERTFRPTAAMTAVNRPTAAQIGYLKKLTRIRTDSQLARFVMRKLGAEETAILTRQDFAKVIDLEISEKRWAA